MHRIDTPTAQIDKFGPGKNGFTNGDPATGRRATDLNSDMWDAVQEEVANAIEGNGIALDKSKHNQLYLAIQKAITDPGFLKKENNLSDLANVAEARGNLQLGTAATKNFGTSTGNVMPVGAFGLGGGGFEFNYTNNADLMAALRAKGSCIFRNTKDGTAMSSWAPGLFARAGDANCMLTINPFSGNVIAAGFTDGNKDSPKVNTLYGTANKPTAADVNAVAKTGDRMSGQLIAPALATTPDAIPWGSGPYAEQLNNQAPFFQPNWQWPVTSGGVFVPIAKGTSTRKGRGWPTAVSYGYLMPGEDMHARPVIHALGDSGIENIWEFNTQTGGLRSGKAGEFATQSWVNNGLGGRVDWDTFNREVGARATTEYVNNNFAKINTDNIGSLAFARLNPQNTTVGYGGLVAGASLSPSGITGYPAGGNWAAIFAEGQLGGTWKCLGICISDTDGGGNRHYGASLFVRVS
ncbi:hypothetical protein [Serratia marcescens]|uniref:hypothetical protein n=1 Tax=Serratia marcescens TaxID=615 RepID=UPI0027E5B358|nr:hypothetical protein [Serratia marcescens]WLS21681.1 hypothetical protein RAA91_11195 [Serratia marcescens]